MSSTQARELGQMGTYEKSHTEYDLTFLGGDYVPQIHFGHCRISANPDNRYLLGTNIALGFRCVKVTTPLDRN